MKNVHTEPNTTFLNSENLHAQDKQDFNSSWNCKVGPSVAIKHKGQSIYYIAKGAEQKLQGKENIAHIIKHRA